MFVAETGHICVNLGFAGYVLGRWFIKVICLEWQSRVGKNNMDTVGDLLARIKNAYRAGLEKVGLAYSKQGQSILELLVKEGYLAGVEVVDVDGKSFKRLEVVLKYEGAKGAVTDLRRVSKPGLRVYKKGRLLPRVLNGLGIAIVSTPKGIMTDKQARKEGVGGEIMAYVW